MPPKAILYMILLNLILMLYYFKIFCLKFKICVIKLTYEIQEKISPAVTRIRTWVASATTKSTNHYTITAIKDRWISKLKIQNLNPTYSASLWLHNLTCTVNVLCLPFSLTERPSSLVKKNNEMQCCQIWK